MKQLLASFLLFIFVSATLGVCVHQHYCGGNLKNTQLFAETSEKGCCGEEQEKEMECCDDVEKVYQLDEDFSATTTTKISPTLFIVKSLFAFLFSIDFAPKEKIAIRLEAPPLPGVPIIKLICTFLI